MSSALPGLRQWAVVILAVVIAVLLVLHLHDVKVHATDQWRLWVDGQNQSALTDSNRILKNGWTAHLAVIAKDSAALAAMGKQYATLAAQLNGLKKEKAKPVLAVAEKISVKMPASELMPLTSPRCQEAAMPSLTSPGCLKAATPSPLGEGLPVREDADQRKEVGTTSPTKKEVGGTDLVNQKNGLGEADPTNLPSPIGEATSKESNNSSEFLASEEFGVPGVRSYREDDTCGGSEFHFAMTMHGDSMRFEKSMRLDLSTLLVERADGKREFRGRSPCPWVTIDGIQGAVFEDAPAVPAKKQSVWASKAAWAIYGAGLLRLLQVILPVMGVK